jgi:murein DD-endopeptidase MepM/ murein hydrolase activator NlpD
MKGSKKSHTLLGILLCIPLAFIVYFAISFSSQSISKDSVKSVTFTVPDGGQYTYTDAKQIEYFVNVILNAKNINSTVRDISEEKPVTIKYDRGDRTVDYNLYLQNNLSGCIAIDSDNKVYILSSDTASDLLMRPEFQFVYDKIMLPELTVVSASNQTTISPLSYDWHYKKVDGSIYTDKTASVFDLQNAKQASIYPNNNNQINFSIKPDDLAISLKTSAGTLSVSDLSYLSFDKDTEVEVTITAKWNQTGSSNYYGEATYSFPLLYDLPATVTLEKKNYNPGDIAVVGIEHLNRDEVVTLDTKLNTPGITCFTQGDISFALIPITTENAAGDYTLDFKMNGASYSEKINVSQVDNELTTMNIGKGKSTPEISDDVLKKTQEKFEQIFSNPCNEAYYTFGTAFVKPVGATVSGKYGSKLSIQNKDFQKLMGVIYTVEEGTEVKAAQRGKVVLAEALPATGLTVVIDHGYGVMSCYFNLKSISANVGDIIRQDEKIGLSGNTGYTGGEGILTYAVSVNGTFVNPEQFESVIRIP